MSNSELSRDAAQLVQAAARLVSAAIERADADALKGIEVALRGGARPVVEVSPHPTAPCVTLWLVEREGHVRHLLATVPIREVRPCAH